jgi:hypothetical protein
MPPDRPVPIGTILLMVGKGMSAQAIREVFPDLKPEDIRGALLSAADVVIDVNASVSRDSVGEIIRSAQQTSGLPEAKAEELAVQEARAARRERTQRSRTRDRS